MTSTQQALEALHHATTRLVERTPKELFGEHQFKGRGMCDCGQIQGDVRTLTCTTNLLPNPAYTQRREALAVLQEPCDNWYCDNGRFLYRDGSKCGRCEGRGALPLQLVRLDGWSTPEGRERALLGVLDVFTEKLGMWSIRAEYDDHGECWDAQVDVGGEYFEARDKPTRLEATLSALTQAVEGLA